MSILYYYIDEQTRELRPEASRKVVAQKDHNADVIRVGVPEALDSVDLETSAVRCMYQRPKETEVRSKTATYYDTSGGYLWYDWTLQEGDTAKAGKINFSVCLQHIEDNLLTVDWNSTIGEIHVKTSYHSDDSDEGDESITPTVAQRVAVLETMIQRVASGAPVVVGSASDMTDTAQIYVLSTDGMWYYYDGSAWIAGGTYGAVATDTTLTQSGVPADAKAVGDALADAMTGEALEDDESMKYVLSSKYDDFKLVDGYGYFDAKKLFDGTFDWSGSPMSGSGYDESPNYVFRYAPHTKKFLLGENTMEWICSPDFPMQEHDFNGGAVYLPEGFWVTFDPDRPTGSRFVTIPKSVFGNFSTIGDFVFNFLDGSIGIKMDSTKIREYDPSDVITAITSGGTTIYTVTTEGVDFYKGFLTYNWTDIFDFENTASNLYRMYSNIGLNEEYTDYAKESVWFSGTTRINYKVKADAVGAKTITAIKDYLVNARHLKFYYVAPDEEEAT